MKYKGLVLITCTVLLAFILICGYHTTDFYYNYSKWEEGCGHIGYGYLALTRENCKLYNFGTIKKEKVPIHGDCGFTPGGCKKEWRYSKWEDGKLESGKWKNGGWKEI